MANLSEDIQCAGSDTRPPMLDKADFVSWQQRIRLYCRGKDNGINILKSIDEGPFQMGTTRGIIDEGTEGSSTVQDGREIVRLYRVEDIGQGKQCHGEQVLIGYGRAQNRVGNANLGHVLADVANASSTWNGVSWMKSSHCSCWWTGQCLLMKMWYETTLFKISFSMWNNGFSSDDVMRMLCVVMILRHQYLFMANLSSADLVYDEAGPSYDSDVLSEVQAHDHYQDAVCDHHEEHEMHDDEYSSNKLVNAELATYKEQVDCMKAGPGVNSCTDASRSQPRSNTKKNRILPAKSVNMKKVEEHPRTIKSSLKTTNRVDSSISSKRTVINSNSHSVCQTCNKCLISANHDMCVVTYLHSVNASPSVKNVVRKVKQVWKPKQVKQVWKPTGNILTTVGYQWMPTGRTFTLGEQCPLTRLTKPNKVSAIAYANPREPNQNWGSNFPNSPSSSVFKCRNFVKKFIGTVRFENDHFGAIMGYEDYVIGECVISKVYYVERLGHNLFSVGQFSHSDLEVAFMKHSCYVRETDGVELIKGYRGSNLYTISIEDIMKSSQICLLSKASKNKSWLWHRHLNHLNIGTINDLARKDLV
ncbi:retrovirus-related pol polyprotein from transposon TNT 1-94 [Tanacetum coccineum]